MHLSFIVIIALVTGQDVPRATVLGRVVDDSTGAPIPFVNIFIANSSLGSSSNEQGKFEIKHIPIGDHEIVASIVGYQRKVLRIHLTEEIRSADFRLKSVMIEMPAVSVTAEYPKMWRENLEKFSQEFLGFSEFGRNCKILNPEVITFDMQNHSTLAAISREPLKIENSLLGYYLEYHLHEFSMQDRVLRFSGFTRFEDLMAKSDEQKTAWDMARKKAFKGSLQHFLAVLAKRRSEEEGFTMRKVPSISFSHKWAPPVYADSIIESTGRSLEKKLRFSGLIEITYRDERADREYKNFLSFKGIQYHDSNMLMSQISWITLNTPSVFVNTLGMPSNPYAITTFGYWSYERVGEMLPFDYKPPAD
ncbi:MAG: carboxypeptidase-like regulatory domain-containing protein [Ignavibacteriales bacterium]|nr:carboxypeptidase-like regulatory domain-containing protein [Ignavibacteriales bacterium]